MRPIDILFAILVAAIWGGNFVSAKFGMEHFPPFFITSLRFALVASLLLIFVPIPNKKQMLQIAQIAFVLGVLHFALLFAALYMGLDIASCAIIGQLGVPFSCMLSAWLDKDTLGPWRMFGMFIAFGGMMIVAGTPNILFNPLAFTIAMAGAFCWGVSNIMIKRMDGVTNFQMLAWMSLLTVPQLLLVSAIFENNQWELMLTATPGAVLSIIYTALFSTIVAYGLWYYLLKAHPVTHVAPFSLLTPVFAIAFGQMFFTENLTWQVIVGGIITITGVAIIVTRRPKLVSLGEST